MLDHNDSNLLEPSQEEIAKFSDRLSETTTPEDFIRKLDELQMPCPWGDLSNSDKFPVPYAPIGLAVGVSRDVSEFAHKGVSKINEFGLFISSDQIPASMAPPLIENYVFMNLIDPKSICLLGRQVHAIMSIGVYTYDSRGVQFQDSQNEYEATKALVDLLMPGGIMAHDTLIIFNRKFPQLLERKFGFKIVKETKRNRILQKPF